MCKTVKYGLVLCDLCSSKPVIFLVEEKARLLSVLDINRILDPIFRYLSKTGMIGISIPTFAKFKTFLAP